MLKTKRVVAYATGESNYTRLHYPDGSSVVWGITLSKICERFPYLLRIHKQHAVNPAFVSWHNDALVKVQNSKPLSVSRRNQRLTWKILSNPQPD